jgi:hypothetical protein
MISTCTEGAATCRPVLRLVTAWQMAAAAMHRSDFAPATAGQARLRVSSMAAGLPVGLLSVAELATQPVELGPLIKAAPVAGWSGPWKEPLTRCCASLRRPFLHRAAGDLGAPHRPDLCLGPIRLRLTPVRQRCSSTPAPANIRTSGTLDDAA